MSCNCDTLTEQNIFMPEECIIRQATQITQTERHFTLQLKSGLPFKYQPGQILEVSLPGFGEIPIGVASSPTRTESFDIVVRSVGRVSTAINARTAGESLWIRGPLGNGYDLNKLRGHNVLVVAGGIGLCPTRSLIQYILDQRAEFRDFKLFFGARSPADQLFTQDLACWRDSPDVDYQETVDQGDDNWTGNVGVITTLLTMNEISRDTRVVICGPPIMYKFVMMRLDSIGIPHENIYVDLERRMKCGVGKCGHCQINDVYVCYDGPVFSYDQVESLEEAI